MPTDPSPPVIRVLIIEDKQSSADGLERDLHKYAAELGATAHVRQMVRDHYSQFEEEFRRWYPHLQPSNDGLIFDITSLDIHFQAEPSEPDVWGGIRLLKFLRSGIADHLGQIVLRSHSSRELLGTSDLVRVQKETTQSKRDWIKLFRAVLQRLAGDRAAPSP